MAFVYMHTRLKSTVLFLNSNVHHALQRASTKYCFRSALSQTGV